MNEARELMVHVPTLRCMEELIAFREGIAANDGPMTAALYAALIKRAEQLGHK